MVTFRRPAAPSACAARRAARCAARTPPTPVSVASRVLCLAGPALLAACLVAPVLAAAPQATSTWTPPEPPAGMPPGMAYYTVVLLERGAIASPPAGDTQRIMQAHLAHMERLYERGWLVASGPIADQGALRGIWILRGVAPEETRRLAVEDPAAKAGLIVPRVLAWWGPAGIGTEYASWRAANPGSPDRMRTVQFGVLVKGPTPLAPSAPGSAELQQQHLKHILGMVAQGAVVAAGPFEDGGDYRGVFVFAMESLEAARALGDADPLVKSGHLALHLWPWRVAEGVLPAPARAQ